jgi:CheY-like chemotaxis protein
MIVDDLAANREILRLLLEHFGHSVHEAESEDQAFDLLERQITPDLAILDLNLRHESGVGLLRRLRSDPIFSPLPVVFASALPNRDAIVEAAGLKIVGFLTKPIDSGRLQTAVGAAIHEAWMRVHFDDPTETCFQHKLDRGVYLNTAGRFFSDLATLVAQESSADPATISAFADKASDLGLRIFVPALRRWRDDPSSADASSVLRRSKAVARLFTAFVSNA